MSQTRFNPHAKPSPGERRQIEIQSEFATYVRCPVCRHRLLARMYPSGPAFRCACLPYNEKRESR